MENQVKVFVFIIISIGLLFVWDSFINIHHDDVSNNDVVVDKSNKIKKANATDLDTTDLDVAPQAQTISSHQTEDFAFDNVKGKIDLDSASISTLELTKYFTTIKQEKALQL